jgi:hypothetical protein
MKGTRMRLRSQIVTVTATVLLVAPAVALAADGTFDRTLHLDGNAYVYVSTGSGYIHVSPGSDDQVHVVGRVHAGNNWGWGSHDDGSPEERVKRVVDNPPVVQVGNTIRIGKLPESVHNVSVDYDVTTPRGAQVEAGSGSGDIRISSIHGGVKADTGSGNIDASDIGGNYVSLETGSGGIRADLATANDVKAHTGSGNVHLGNVKGSLKTETGSGNIEISGQPSQPWKAQAGSGNVTLITGNAHFSLDAQTGSGSVHSDPAISTHGNQEHHHISGDINGGGVPVRIETGSGDITIH